MTYRIEFRSTARRALADLPRDIAKRIDARILKLADEPRPSGVKALQGEQRGRLRIRVGDYRVIYEVQDRVLVVLVLEVGHRRDVYDR